MQVLRQEVDLLTPAFAHVILHRLSCENHGPWLEMGVDQQLFQACNACREHLLPNHALPR